MEGGAGVTRSQSRRGASKTRQLSTGTGYISCVLLRALVLYLQSGYKGAILQGSGEDTGRCHTAKASSQHLASPNPASIPSLACQSQEHALCFLNWLGILQGRIPFPLWLSIGERSSQ